MTLCLMECNDPSINKWFRGFKIILMVTKVVHVAQLNNLKVFDNILYVLKSIAHSNNLVVVWNSNRVGVSIVTPVHRQ